MDNRKVRSPFLWFIIGLMLITVGLTRRRARVLAGVGAAFVAIGFVQSRRTNSPE